MSSFTMEIDPNDPRIILFKFPQNTTELIFKTFLQTLDRLLDEGKPFAFVVYANDTTISLIKAGMTLVKWMKKNKENGKIKKCILASAIIIKYKKISDIINWVFKKQKPVSPNFVTNDETKALDFVRANLQKTLEQMTSSQTNINSGAINNESNSNQENIEELVSQIDQIDLTNLELN